MASLEWEKVDETKNPLVVDTPIYRAKVPEGWLVGLFAAGMMGGNRTVSLIFCPDPNHEWK
jgi:hypothetical protein